MHRNNYIAVQLIDSKLYAINCYLKNDFSIIDLETGYVSPFFEEGGFRENGINPINIIHKYKDGFLCVDDSGSTIIKTNAYDTRKIEYFCLDMRIYNLAYPQCIWSSIHNDCLYVFSAFEDTLYIFDIEKKTVVVNEAVFGGNKSSDNEKLYVYAYEDKNILYLIRKDGEIHIFNLLDSSKGIIKLSCGECIVNARYHKGKVYLLSEKGRVYYYDEYKSINEIEIKDSEIKLLSDKKVWAMAVCDDRIYFMPGVSDKIYYLKYKERLGELYEYENQPCDLKYNCAIKEQFKFFLSSENDEMVCFANPTTQYIAIVEKHTGNMRWLKPEAENKKEDIKRLFMNHGTVSEFEGSLEQFVEYLTEDVK